LIEISDGGDISKEPLLIENERANYSAVVSPDGSAFAFLSAQEGHVSLYTAEFGEKEPARVGLEISIAYPDPPAERAHLLEWR